MKAIEAKNQIKQALKNNNINFKCLELDSCWKIIYQDLQLLDGIFEKPNTDEHYCVNVDLNGNIKHLEKLDW